MANIREALRRHGMLRGETLKERLQEAARKVWGQIAADVNWPVTLEEAAELAIDADRPVVLGGMTAADYDALIDHQPDEVLGWAADALRGLV